MASGIFIFGKIPISETKKFREINGKKRRKKIKEKLRPTSTGVRIRNGIDAVVTVFVSKANGIVNYEIYDKIFGGKSAKSTL